MRRNHGAYYHVVDGRWTRLATADDRAGALRAWAEIEGAPPPANTGTLQAAWDAFQIHPNGLATRSPRTRSDYGKDSARILAVFGRMPLASIKPQHVRRYLDERVDKHGNPAHVRATREKALLSLLITFAREQGLTTAPNPCAGIKGWKAKRTRYVTDDELARILATAPEPVRDALEIALYTGQRPADVRKLLRTDLRDGALWITQNKTGARLRVAVEGPLAATLERCKARAAALKVTSLHLVTDATGQPYNEWTLRAHVRAAAAAAGVPDFQLRDLRAKAATDLDDLARAQSLLGHKGRAMTEEYVRERRGRVVMPYSPNKRQ